MKETLKSLRDFLSNPFHIYFIAVGITALAILGGLQYRKDTSVRNNEPTSLSEPAGENSRFTCERINADLDVTLYLLTDTRSGREFIIASAYPRAVSIVGAHTMEVESK